MFLDDFRKNLGNGVIAEFDGIVLSVRLNLPSINCSFRIPLPPEAMQELIAFSEKVYKEREQN